MHKVNEKTAKAIEENEKAIARSEAEIASIEERLWECREVLRQLYQTRGSLMAVREVLEAMPAEGTWDTEGKSRQPV